LAAKLDRAIGESKEKRSAVDEGQGIRCFVTTLCGGSLASFALQGGFELLADFRSLDHVAPV